MRIGVGLSIPELTTRGGGGSAAFRQSGPTLDLAFVPISTTGLPTATENYSLDLNFVTNAYNVAEHYMVWS